MKRNFFTVAIAVLAIAMTSCKDNKEEKQVGTVATEETTAFTGQDGHNSQNSLDWSGAYQGVVPCADCEGIDLTLTLNEDGTFSEKLVYLGKAEDTTIEQKGTFTWDETGSIITLKSEEETSLYQVREGSLKALDENGKEITGPLADHYNLKKK